MSGSGEAGAAWVKLALLQPTPRYFHAKQDGPVTIGRSRSCDVIINDKRMSSVHCKIYRGVEQEDGTHQVVIEDCSSNGTKLQRDGEELKALSYGEKETLRAGDLVYLVRGNQKQGAEGVISLRIEKPDPPASPRPSSGAGKPGEKLLFGKYRPLKHLGSGSFAKVRLAFDVEENRLVALKFIDKDHFFSSMHTDRPEARTAEVDLLKSTRHSNIVAFFGEHEDEENIVLCLEYVSGGELFDYVVENGRLSESDARNMFREMVEAVAYLHSKGIVHRDLKPENILIKRKIDNTLTIKITDFGLSRLIPEGSFMMTVAGSPGYFAPEVTMDGNSSAASHGYTKKVDIWSLGVILYILLSGVPPYDPRITNISNIKIRFPMPHFSGVSQNAKDLILACLSISAETRPTAAQVLQHPWLMDVRLRRLASDGRSSGGRSETSDMPAPDLPMRVKRKRIQK